MIAHLSRRMTALEWNHAQVPSKAILGVDSTVNS